MCIRQALDRKAFAWAIVIEGIPCVTGHFEVINYDYRVAPGIHDNRDFIS